MEEQIKVIKPETVQLPTTPITETPEPTKRLGHTTATTFHQQPRLQPIDAKRHADRYLVKLHTQSIIDKSVPQAPTPADVIYLGRGRYLHKEIKSSPLSPITPVDLSVYATDLAEGRAFAKKLGA